MEVSKKVKIGIDISQIVYQGTGVAAYTKSLVESLSRVDKDNKYVLFGSSLRSRGILKEFARKLPKEKFVSKFSFFPPKFLEFLWNGIHLFPVENLIGNVDVFHSSDWLEPPTRSAKKITTVHDLAIYKFPEVFAPRGGHDIVANQKRKLFFVKNYSDLIIAVSETTKNDIIDILKIPEKKIRVIYEAADLMYYERKQKEIDEVKEKFSICGDYFLCVGTREPRKNLDRVVMAFTRVAEKLPEMSLVIAGKYGWGNDSSKCNPPAGGQSSKLESKVKLLGYVEKEDLVRLYSGARAFIYPSLYEGFGLPILEAMSCGCPVVTSNLGSMKEISGGAALLVDPESIKSIVEKMLEITEAEGELKQKGLLRAKDFSWEKTALKTMEAYRSLLD